MNFNIFRRRPKPNPYVSYPRLPDKLVTAAADAVFDRMRDVPVPTRDQANEFDRQVVSIAIAAAFAALPECEEAVNAAKEAAYHEWCARHVLSNLARLGES